MTQNSRWVLAAASLLPCTLFAQESLDPARAAAKRDADLYAICMTRKDVDCILEMTAQGHLAAAGVLEEEVYRLGMRATLPVVGLEKPGHHRMEMAEPWPPFSGGDELFAFVPYFESFGYAEGGPRKDGTGYLIAVSEDAGESWRFIQVDNTWTLPSNDIDRVIPGYGDGPRPPILEFDIRDRTLGRSRWLQMTERRFAPVDEAYVYVVGFSTRQESAEPIDVTISYDDPNDRDRPLQFSTQLTAGLPELQWESPPLRGFEVDRIYDIVIEGRGVESGRRLFSQRETLIFHPTRELLMSEWSKPPESLATN